MMKIMIRIIRVGLLLKVTKEVMKSLTKWKKRKVMFYKKEFLKLLQLKNRTIIMMMKEAHFQHVIEKK